MPDPQWTAVDDHVTDLVVRPDAALEAAVAATASAGMRLASPPGS
jgi:hypothetical protein